MFDEPPAKRVRRDELFDRPSSSRSRSTSPTGTSNSHDIHHPRTHNVQTNDALAQRVDYGFEYDIVAPPGREMTSLPPTREGGSAKTLNEEDADVVEEDEGLEFRLFSSKAEPVNLLTRNGELRDHDSTTKPSSSAIQRIRIHSPTRSEGGEDGSGGFVNPHRRRDYYFTFEEAEEAQGIKGEQFRNVAISGEGIGQLASVTWYGTLLPWRVSHLSSSSQSLSSLRPIKDPPTSRGDRGRRTRPGKKRRLVLRKRQSNQLAVEMAEREKKTRRNREKKVKKKLRDKIKKDAEEGQREMAAPVENGESNQV